MSFFYKKKEKSENKRVFLMGVPFDKVTRDEAVNKILGFLGQQKQFFVTTPNPEMLVEASRNAEFKTVLKKADLSVADGIGILWASTFIQLQASSYKLQAGWNVLKSLFWVLFFPKQIRKILPERVCGSDLFLDLCRESEAKVFLLGAGEGVAKKTAKVLEVKFPKIKIAGTYAGSPSVKEEKTIIEKVNQSGAELLFVAYGAPKQELWIERNLKKMLKVRVGMGIGGSFDFVAGVQKRSPRIMQRFGLEWLWRLVREPKRFGRIWNATGRFVILITNSKLRITNK